MYVIKLPRTMSRVCVWRNGERTDCWGAGSPDSFRFVSFNEVENVCFGPCVFMCIYSPKGWEVLCEVTADTMDGWMVG